MYKSVKPLSQQSNYLPNQIVDFVINEPNRDILKNSFYISGNLTIFHDGVNPLGAQQVYIDRHAGVFAVMNQIQVSSNDAVIESTQYIGRYMAMQSDASETDNRMACRLSDTSALRFPIENNSTLVSGSNKSFMVSLPCCLNRATRQFDGDELANIKISLTLADKQRVLYGADVNANTTYVLSDLQVHYFTAEKSKKQGKLGMITIDSMRQSVDSDHNNITMYNSKPIMRVIASCNLLSNEQTATTNYLAREPLSGLNRVEWSINDVENNVFNYPLENAQEIAYHYLQALGDSDLHKALSPSHTKGIGLPINSLIANSQIGVDLQFSTARDLVGYFYMVGMVSV